MRSIWSRASRIRSSRRRPSGDVSAAHERGQLVVHYQPIVASAPPHRAVAVEALLRWNHPDGQLLTAATFIDIAISRGVIGAFGRWVITEVCAQMRTWVDELGDAAPATAYLNLCARELSDVALPDALAAALLSFGLVPAQIGLEIVENDFADADTTTRIQVLRERGHPLSIDDFGTGFSSLSRLLDLPTDLAKIDRSIIEGLPDNTRRAGLVDAVLAVARKLDLQVVAEGVETTAQQDHLTEAGCQLLQGYLLARPQPPEDLTAAWRLEAAVYDHTPKP